MLTRLRTLSAAAAATAIMGLSAIPAAAVALPKVHTFKLPALAGLKTWGSYYTAAGKAHITVCTQEATRIY